MSDKFLQRYIDWCKANGFGHVTEDEARIHLDQMGYKPGMETSGARAWVIAGLGSALIYAIVGLLIYFLSSCHADARPRHRHIDTKKHENAQAWVPPAVITPFDKVHEAFSHHFVWPKVVPMVDVLHAEAQIKLANLVDLVQAEEEVKRKEKAKDTTWKVAGVSLIGLGAFISLAYGVMGWPPGGRRRSESAVDTNTSS